MSIQSQINRINAAVNTQADKIAQIKTALEGKAAGGGGGGASVETCTLTIGGSVVENNLYGIRVAYTFVDETGKINAQCIELSYTDLVFTVVKGSCVTLFDFDRFSLSGVTAISRDGVEDILDELTDMSFIAFYVHGDNASITFD